MDAHRDMAAALLAGDAEAVKASAAADERIQAASRRVAAAQMDVHTVPGRDRRRVLAAQWDDMAEWLDRAVLRVDSRPLDEGGEPWMTAAEFDGGNKGGPSQREGRVHALTAAAVKVVAEWMMPPRFIRDRDGVPVLLMPREAWYEAAEVAAVG